jgi:Asp-tRNA(Asn)/Glu-tRNA(Gln) amidotransferase A subunit family amidase
LAPPLAPAATAHPAKKPAAPQAQAEQAANLSHRGGGFQFETISDFASAYREGTTDPNQVAEAVLKAVAATEEGSRPLRLFIAQDADDLRAQAEASAKRLAEGKPLSIVDGVPIAVKDELDQVPYPTTVGTKFLGERPAAADATLVARLRAAGALLIGKANMHEIGIGMTGLNPHHGVCRNPYDTGRHTGGSSSGPAASVAAGLCPTAIGVDGGGSIRVPAAFCGMVGLKPTNGRVSEHGAAPLAWSVAAGGPISATARDAAAVYALIAGPDEHDPPTLNRPPVHLEGLENSDLSGVTLGMYQPWFEDAEPVVVDACKAAVDRLKEAGARVEAITIPDIDAVGLAHVVIIASEMLTSQLPYYRRHRTHYGLDVQFNLAIAREFGANTYIHALRQRTRFTRIAAEVLQKVDGIVLPTSGCVAPPIPESTLPNGESNLPLLDQIMHFGPFANITALPSISFPVGYDDHLMPISLQVMGRHWEEHLLLRIAHAAEGMVERRKPQVWHSLLGREATSGAAG